MHSKQPKAHNSFEEKPAVEISTRQQRVSELLKSTLDDILTKDEHSNEVVKNASVQIELVEITK